MNEEVLKKVEELSNNIKESESYLKYKELKEQVGKNHDIIELINDIKALQKKAVRETSKGKDVKKIDLEIKKKVDTLNEIPLYKELEYAREDLDNMLQTTKTIIENYINSKTN